MTVRSRAKPLVVDVALGDRSYDIVIGRRLMGTLGARIAALRPGAKTVIVTDENVARYYLRATETALGAAGMTTSGVIVPPGEASKSFQVFEEVCEAIIAARAERGDLVIALGGGVVGDLAGFAASAVRAASTTCRSRPRCWRRSIPRSAARPRSIPPRART